MASLPIARTRTTRKDSRQNRAHLLEIAGRAFASEGVEVSMDAIAKQAGVGSATLYRHFPSKDALLLALLAPHHQTLELTRASIETEETDTGRRLERWIKALGDWMLAYDGLPEPLRAAWSTAGSTLWSTCDGLIATTDRFLRAAQHDGHAQAALSGQDVFLGALAVAWASGRQTAQQHTRDVLHDMLRTGWAAAHCHVPVVGNVRSARR